MQQIHCWPGLRPGHGWASVVSWGSLRRSARPVVGWEHRIINVYGWEEGYPLPIPHLLDAVVLGALSLKPLLQC